MNASPERRELFVNACSLRSLGHVTVNVGAWALDWFTLWVGAEICAADRHRHTDECLLVSYSATLTWVCRNSYLVIEGRGCAVGSRPSPLKIGTSS